MIISYATQPGQTAADGRGRNSPYTTAFLKNIETNEEIGTVFRHMTADVYNETQGKQLPELSLSYIGDFYLKGGPNSEVAAASTALSPAKTDSPFVMAFPKADKLPTFVHSQEQTSSAPGPAAAQAENDPTLPHVQSKTSTIFVPSPSGLSSWNTQIVTGASPILKSELDPQAPSTLWVGAPPPFPPSFLGLPRQTDQHAPNQTTNIKNWPGLPIKNWPGLPRAQEESDSTSSGPAPNQTTNIKIVAGPSLGSNTTFNTAAAMPPLPTQPSATPKSSPWSRNRSADEIDRMVSRGEAYLAQGDVSAARVVLVAAAEAHDPRAALLLGSTYDPAVLQRMGSISVTPDPDKARYWYERAAEFGSGEAQNRLKQFAR